MMEHDHPFLEQGLAVRLSHKGCQIRRPARIYDVVQLSGSAYLFMRLMNGRRAVASILDTVASQTGVDRAILSVDLDELWAGLLRRGLADSSPTPTADRDYPFLEVVADELRSTIHVDVTHKCNERCIHCLVPRNQQQIGTDDICDLMAQAARLGFVGMAFSGGEPTLHPDFWEILRKSRQLGFYFTVFTNGLTFSEEEIVRLAELEPEQVRISIYSMDPDTHDRITTISGSFAQTMRTILGLKEAGVRIYINSPVTNRNFDDFRGIAAFCERHGFEGNLDPVVQPTRDRTNVYRELQLTYDQARDVTGFQQNADELVVNVRPGFPVCNVGDDPSVDANLNVYPCPGLRLLLGNLRDRSLEQLVVQHPLLPELRGLSLDNLNVCQTCNVRDGCYRCHGHAFQESGDFRLCAAMDRRQARIRRDLMVERGTREP